jgi:hypothetical protein
MANRIVIPEINKEKFKFTAKKVDKAFCLNCRKELKKEVTGLHKIKNGFICDDCYIK